jgi:hypothetical protein
MSAASPAQTQVRRTAAAAPSRAPQPAAQQAQARQEIDFGSSRGDEEIRLNLADIPVMRGTLDVEGFKPSMLSRLLNLVSPLR